MREITVIMDLGFGSSGKGQIGGMLGRLWGADTVAAANHPNAGHTFLAPDGSKVVHTILPVNAINPSVKKILIGPGAVVDPEQLIRECIAARGLLRDKHIIIHPNAARRRPEHLEAEKALVSIGSTMKGSMEAVVSKMRRDRGDDPALMGAYINTQVVSKLLAKSDMDYVEEAVSISINASSYMEALEFSTRLIIEGAQGFGLGIHTSFYPFCTSRDVSVHQLLADCRIPFTHEPINIVGVHRTYPIRVANRYDEKGNQIGYSGPGYPGQAELSWSDLKREPELTTVTRLPRRIFEYSTQQMLDACQVIRPTTIALTFCDYLAPCPSVEYPGAPVPIPAKVLLLIDRIHAASHPARVGVLSFGPKPEDMWLVTPTGMRWTMTQPTPQALAEHILTAGTEGLE